MVFGVTNAFFSDTETSTENVLSAGSVDLKVDHIFASYNGENCQEGNCIPTGLNLILNDGFEGPPTVTHSTGWDIFNDGTTGLGWHVEWVNSTTPFGGFDRPTVAKIEFHKNGNLGNTNDISDGWVAHGGKQYIELDSDWVGHTATLNNEPALARIYQDVPTVVGKKYQLKYWHSYRPGQGLSENTMNVYADTAPLRTVTADGTSQSNTLWIEYVDEFTATNALTRITFEGSGNDNSLGIFLDDVSLYELSCQTQLNGNSCSLWEEKDLTKNDIFWNFDDVKPGDYGRNVVSLHVVDNDAYICASVDGDDDENELIESEKPFDTTPDIGELSKYIKLFAWKDLDFDGVYEPPTEIALAENFVDLLNNIPFAESPNPVTGGSTNYLGLAWCFGEQTVDHTTGEITCSGEGSYDDAQTDIFEAVLRFYTEQSRNNPSFDCDSLDLDTY